MTTDQSIPVLDLSQEIKESWGELTAAIESVLKSTQFINGPEVGQLEAEIAAYLGVKYAVGMNSGTDALVLGLRALGVKEGDEVITTAFTFFATTEAIMTIGAIPVYVDIDPKTYNLDVSQIREKISSRTRAIIPVHLYGQAADMDVIMELAAKNNLKVLEDVAQAFSGSFRGKKLATIGDAGALSFFPSKNLGCFGDGGMLVTNDESVMETARMLRVHGAKRKYYNEVVGYNSRLDTLQAAILRVKLPSIEKASAGRRAAAGRYNEMLAGIPKVIAPYESPNAHHVYHQYTIRLVGVDRDAVQQRLKKRGVESMVYYPVPVHKLPAEKRSGIVLPKTEEAARQVLSLPMWPTIAGETQLKVVEALRDSLIG